MIGYVTLGTNDLPRAASFYDQVLGALGAKRFMETDKFIAWSRGPQEPGLSLTLPFDGGKASVGNGVMVALNAADPAQVDQVYATAIEQGGTCEGKPGDRGGGFYAAYFRDLDGNKLNAFCMVAAEG